MFKRGYWIIPIVIVLVTYSYAPVEDWKRYWDNHWDVPVVEIPVEIPVVETPIEDSVIRCSYKNVEDNGYDFRIEICATNGGATVTIWADGVIVERAEHVKGARPKITAYDVNFWAVYDKKTSKRWLKKIKRNMPREDI